MISRNYESPQHLAGCSIALALWAEARETDYPVAVAIHAVSKITRRTPQAIWEAPEESEYEGIREALAEYLSHGDFRPSDTGRFQWGVSDIAPDPYANQGE